MRSKGCPMLVPDLDHLFIGPAATLREAMMAIDAGGFAIALVVGADQTLKATVTDGDIRRALLRGATLNDAALPYASPRPYTVTSATPRDHVLDVMRARSILHVPVCDDAGRVTGLHAIREWLGARLLPNTAVLMAGGRGTRLGPLTDEIPKPMLKVAGRPVLEWQVLHLMSAGIRKVVISVNYRADVIKEHFGDGSAIGCAISYLEEKPDEPLGTAGALALMPERVGLPDVPLVVMNGDLMTRFAIEGLLQHHATHASVATIAVRDYHHQIPFGVVRVDATGSRVSHLEEKPTVSFPVNAGIYVFEPSVIARLRPGPRDITTVLADCIERGEPVTRWSLEDEWIDIGQPPDLRRAQGH
jgi:dTDP-glucose pyrophosphorylase